MSLNYFIKLAGTCTVVFLMTGCAKTNIQKTSEFDMSGMPKPTTVLIYNFSIDPQAVQQNSSPLSRIARSFENDNETVEKLKLGNEVAEAMTKELTKKILEMGLNPQRADQSSPIVPGSILITGQIVKIDEGNSIRRNVIGFGAGQSSLDATISVLAPSSSGNKELITFNAHGDSGEKPGALVMGPAGAAAGAGAAATAAVNVAKGAANAYKSASATQAADMAEKISTELARYFAKEGWINSDLAKK